MWRSEACLAVVCALLAAAWTGEALKVKECAGDDYLRLPKRVLPEHYNLEVFVDPDALAFTGEVNIDVRHPENWDNGRCSILAATGKPKSLACDKSTIVLSAYRSMQITALEYQDRDSGARIPLESVCRLSRQDLLVLRLTRELAPGSAGQLRVAYQAERRTDFTGLFRAEYRDVKTGQFRNVSATKFEPGYARRAFPCFDEPEFKATYELAVFHPSNLRAISNTPVASIEEQALVWPGKEFSKTNFGRTPRMSSYLLAFAVGEFDYIESKADGAMTIGMYTPPGRAQEARAQLTTAVQAYNKLRDFFGVDQPMSKLDFVSIRDFPAAMENWGMIVIEEAMLLQDRDQLDAGYIDRARDTIIHEISHQWFGNLVTMKWWDDLWLNEGFAQWMGTEISEQLSPHVGANAMWMLNRRRRALEMDANERRTHPIKNRELRTVAEISATFDPITYDKGQSVIKMLDNFLGRAKFRQGLRTYLQRHAYGNTEDTDLWQILTETSGVDVRGIMHNWLYQSGFPMISVRMVRAGEIEVAQKSYNVPGSGQKWTVPIVLSLSDGQNRMEQVSFFLSARYDTVKVPDWFDIEKPGHWLKLNAGSMGFYYVDYDYRLYDALQQPIETKTMSPVDRYNVLEENLGFLRARKLERDDFLELLSWFKREDDDAVVALICAALDYLRVNDYYAHADLFASLTSHLERHGLEDDTSDKASLMKLHARGDVLYKLVNSNYKPAIEASLELFAKANGKVPGFLRDGVYLAVGLAGTDEQFKQVVSALANYDSQTNGMISKIQLSKARGLAQERIEMIGY